MNETLNTPLAILKFNFKTSTFKRPFKLYFKHKFKQSAVSYKKESVFNNMISYRIGVPNNYKIIFNDIGSENYTVRNSKIILRRFNYFIIGFSNRFYKAKTGRIEEQWNHSK